MVCEYLTETFHGTSHAFDCRYFDGQPIATSFGHLGIDDMLTVCAVQKRWLFLLGISLMKATYDILYIYSIYNFMIIFFLFYENLTI